MNKKFVLFLAATVLVAGGFFVPNLAWALVTTSSATLDGGASANVAPGATVNVVVTVDMTAASNAWHGTFYYIGTSAPADEVMTCLDTVNYDGIGSFTDNLILTAPALPGNYNVYFKAKPTNTCTASGTAGSLLALTDGLVVSLPAVPGCMDIAATNYNSSATQDDGSCTYPEVTPEPEPEPEPEPATPAPDHGGSSKSGSSRRNLIGSVPGAGNVGGGEVLGAFTSNSSSSEVQLEQLQQILTDLTVLLGKLKSQI